MTETLTFRRRSAVGEIQKNDDCVILHCHCYFTFQIHINSSSYIHTRFLIAPLLLASSTIARTFRSISVPGLPLPALRQPAYLSQCGQDYVLQRLFKNATGLFYVDLAAHDPAYLSSTYFLDRVLHWRGLCIEGNYQHFTRCSRSAPVTWLVPQWRAPTQRRLLSSICPAWLHSLVLPDYRHTTL
jgi:hypothetical protein